MKNNRCRYSSGMKYWWMLSLKSWLVCKFNSVWARYAEPFPQLTFGNAWGKDEWDRFRAYLPWLALKTSSVNLLPLSTGGWCFSLDLSIVPFHQSLPIAPSLSMTSWVDATPVALPHALPILFNSYNDSKNICKMGIIGGCEETKIWRVRNLPGPSAHCGKAEVHAEALLSPEPTC